MIERLAAGSPEQQLCAEWRHEAFLKDDGFSVADSYGQLQTLATTEDALQTALIARVKGACAGIVLVVREEIDAVHDVSPWLASLYVDEAYRGRGVARALIAAAEAHARSHGVERLYLYTVDAQPLYLKCGWTLRDSVTQHGSPLHLMSRDLRRFAMRPSGG